MASESLLNVLVVEKDPAFLQLIHIFLTSQGHESTPVATAAAAVEAVKRDPTRFHVLIANVVMDDSNGWELANNIRALNPAIKVIVTSGEPRFELNQQLGIEVPEDAFLRKPFGREMLMQRIKHLTESD